MTTQAIPTGNTFDKYGSESRVVRRLVDGFEWTAADLLVRTRPTSILDVGCGEGVLSERWARAFPETQILGIDLPDQKLEREWDRPLPANLSFEQHDVAVGLPFDDNAFDVATATEVLEHVPSAEDLVAEMARVASSHILVSVPREPLWRIINVARGTYVRQLGNTPGHVNHWSKRRFVEMLSRHGDVVEARSPFPWTMVLVRVR